MKGFLFAAGALALILPAATTQNQPEPAQPPAKREGRDTRPARPAPNQPQGFPNNPWGDTARNASSRLSAARITSLQDEIELVEAQRDVRRAHVRAAQVAVRAAEAQFQLIKAANVPALERMKAEVEVEAARAQLEIKEAELKEVEVRVKHAKKRLADLKDAARPAPARPGAIDPPAGGGRGRDRGAGDPPPAERSLDVRGTTFALAVAADEKLIEALKADIAKRKAEAKKHQEEIEKAETFLKEAVKERAKASTERDSQLAEAKVKAGRAQLALQRDKADVLKRDIAKLEAKLEEVQKN